MMTSWFTFLVGITACLGFALAAPVEEAASDVTPVGHITIETKLHTDRTEGRAARPGPLPLLSTDPSFGGQALLLCLGYLPRT